MYVLTVIFGRDHFVKLNGIIQVHIRQRFFVFLRHFGGSALSSTAVWTTVNIIDVVAITFRSLFKVVAFIVTI